MEDQKLLWIVFSVVLFAVVVLASVLYFLKPTTTEPAVAMATAGPPTGAGIDTYEYVRGTSSVLPMEGQRPGERELQVVVGEEPAAQGGPAATAPAATAQPRPADQPKPSAATAAAAACALCSLKSAVPLTLICCPYRSTAIIKTVCKSFVP
jgi:hypothetical protein